MIELKRCNYITGQINYVIFGFSKIVDFFENSGKTPLFLYRKGSNFQKLIHTSSIEFKDKNQFDEILTDSSNLFRVDLILVDLWFLNGVSQVISYKNELDKLNIDYIILTNKYHYIKSDVNVNIYKIDTEFDQKNYWNSEAKYFIEDLIGDTRVSMDDLILSFKRNKKIDDIID